MALKYYYGIKSNLRKGEYDKWLAAGGAKSGLPEPQLPFLYDNLGGKTKVPKSSKINLTQK